MMAGLVEWSLSALPGLELASANADWAASGAMWLTGARGAPPGIPPIGTEVTERASW
jgi:hypothetical protein